MLHYQWWIQGRSPRSFLDQTGAGRAKKIFLGDQAPPPYLRLWMTGLLPPPTPLSPCLDLAMLSPLLCLLLHLFVSAALPVVDPGEVPPLILRPNWGRKGQKNFFGRPSPPALSKALDDRAPPPPTPLSPCLDLVTDYRLCIRKTYRYYCVGDLNNPKSITFKSCYLVALEWCIIQLLSLPGKSQIFFIYLFLKYFN